jgi:hypothetical protein
MSWQDVQGFYTEPDNYDLVDCHQCYGKIDANPRNFDGYDTEGNPLWLCCLCEEERDTKWLPPLGSRSVQHQPPGTGEDGE